MVDNKYTTLAKSVNGPVCQMEFPLCASGLMVGKLLRRLLDEVDFGIFICLCKLFVGLLLTCVAGKAKKKNNKNSNNNTNNKATS